MALPVREDYEWDPAELLIENKCDDERYLFLNEDEDEVLLYEDEIAKREKVKGTSAEVAFDYSEEQSSPQENQQDGAAPADTSTTLASRASTSPPIDEDAAAEPEDLQLETTPFAANTIFPNTKKQLAIIERTAVFVNANGAQIEILLKAQQSRNGWMQFLMRGHRLNSFYIQLRGLISSGEYEVQVEPRSHEKKPATPEQVSDGQDAEKNQNTSDIDAARAASDTSATEPHADESNTAMSQTSDTKAAADVVLLQRPLVQYDSDSDESDSDEATSGAKATLPVASKQGDSVTSSQEVQSATTRASQDVAVKRQATDEIGSASTKRRHIDSLSGVSSKSGSPSPMVIPPPDVKAMIDRIADYVARNGQAFENKLKANQQDNPKFAFLLPRDEFYLYYVDMVKFLKQRQSRTDKEPLQQASASPCQIAVPWSVQLAFSERGLTQWPPTPAKGMQRSSGQETSNHQQRAAVMYGPALPDRPGFHMYELSVKPASTADPAGLNGAAAYETGNSESDNSKTGVVGSDAEPEKPPPVVDPLVKRKQEERRRRAARLVAALKAQKTT